MSHGSRPNTLPYPVAACREIDTNGNTQPPRGLFENMGEGERERESQKGRRRGTTGSLEITPVIIYRPMLLHRVAV